MGLSLKQLKEYSRVYYKDTSKNNAIEILFQQQKVLSQQQTRITTQLEQIENKLTFLKQSSKNFNDCQNKELTIITE
ncbi:hypothetical protein RV15_GL001802 [Enterococcus silesiacus]|nr:hypothetical protein RV15_GL001802 [Enterococcus silesiacus]